jgi:hypothetical protein
MPVFRCGLAFFGSTASIFRYRYLVLSMRYCFSGFGFGRRVLCPIAGINFDIEISRFFGFLQPEPAKRRASKVDKVCDVI